MTESKAVIAPFCRVRCKLEERGLLNFYISLYFYTNPQLWLLMSSQTVRTVVVAQITVQEFPAKTLRLHARHETWHKKNNRRSATMGDNTSGRKETRQRMNQQHLQPKKQLTQTVGGKDWKTNNQGHVSSIFCSD